MRNMMGAGRVRCVHCMRQGRCNDVMLVVQMRQKEKFRWDAFGVVVFLGEEQGNEIMRGLRWWVTRQPKGQPDSGVAGRQAGRSEAAGISPASRQSTAPDLHHHLKAAKAR